jgi:Arc/MetJ-type ribon-helix-helix transcriptional regulator
LTICSDDPRRAGTRLADVVPDLHLEAAIARGRFANRSEALRAGLDRILYEERQDEIDERYAAGYGRHPQKEWIGALGLAGLAAFDGAEDGPSL